MLVNEETYQPDTICINEYNAVNMADLENALRMSKNRKAPGIDEINMELIKYASIKLIIQLLNDIWNVVKIPEEWKIARIVNIHKNGDKRKYSNYRGISLLSSAYKIYMTIIKSKLQPIAEEILQEKQCGFHKGRSCIDAIIVIKKLIEKRREYNLPLFLLFLDYEKAYDRVDRYKLWNILTEYGLPLNLVNAIKSLYDNASKMFNKENKDITGTPRKVNQGLRQSCGLSPILLTYILTRN
jgi:sorting nexin-29